MTVSAELPRAAVERDLVETDVAVKVVALAIGPPVPVVLRGEILGALVDGPDGILLGMPEDRLLDRAEDIPLGKLEEGLVPAAIGREVPLLLVEFMKDFIEEVVDRPEVTLLDRVVVEPPGNTVTVTMPGPAAWQKTTRSETETWFCCSGRQKAAWSAWMVRRWSRAAAAVSGCLASSSLS